MKGNPVLFSGFRYLHCRLKVANCGIGIRSRIFQHLRRLFRPGTIKKIPCCIIELWVRFREESSAFGRFCRLEFQRMANWPSFCPESSRIGRFCRLDFQRMTNLSSFCTVLKIWASWPSVGIRACKIGQSHHTLSKIDH